MQPAMPFHGLRRATWRAEITIICSGRQRATTALPSVPRHASASSMRPSARGERGQRGGEVGAAHLEAQPGYSGVSTGVASALLAASNQRARRSRPQLDARVGARAEAQQRGVERGELGGDALGLRRRQLAPAQHWRDRPASTHSRRTSACASSTSARRCRGLSRRTTACSKVFSAATWRTLT